MSWMNHRFVIGAIALGSLLGSLGITVAPVVAQDIIIQTETRIDLSRAKNLARQAAESANGGLGQYRAEASMHGPVEDAPYIENADGSWTFTFQGYDPADIAADGSVVYSVETQVTVTPLGAVTMNYNHSIP